MLRSHSQNGAKIINELTKSTAAGHTSTKVITTKLQSRLTSTSTPPWRPISILDDYVQKEARPISLRQLTYFGRTLTESRLLSSANYVRTELPTRLAHRIRDMQTLPYVVVTNPHISEVYELYYKAFENLRRVKEITSLEDNEKYCEKLKHTLREHLSVIPKLAMGVLETRDLLNQEAMDTFMNTILRSRISRRVIAEQHIALTSTFNSLQPSTSTASNPTPPSPEFVGSVFLKCNAKDVITHCANRITSLARLAYGPETPLPEIQLLGHLDATFPYILSHIEYIIGEMLRNSVQATVELQKQKRLNQQARGEEGPMPIEVTICEAPQHVIIRISDRGGGIPQNVMPYLWSFSNGPHCQKRLENLHRVPKMAATLEEIEVPKEEEIQKEVPSREILGEPENEGYKGGEEASSLVSLTSRPPNLRLGMGLPMSRVYAEYWAGSLQVHSLEGYGVDAFLSISRLGNKNEQLSGRASMDGV